jgi:hypothetical protein
MNLDTTTIIAIYGAALSTILAATQLYRFRIEQQEKKPRIKVTLTTGLISQGGATSPALLTLTAANIGRQPVTLTTTPSLLLPDTQKAILLSATSNFQLPYELQPGKSLDFWDDIHQLARTLKRQGYSGKMDVIGEFGDAIGNKYRSKPFPFDIEDWAK